MRAASNMLLFLICIVGGVGASDDPPTVVDAAGKTDRRRLIEQILAADLPLEARTRALKPYIDVGKSRNEIEKLLPPPSSIHGFGLGVRVVVYGSEKTPGLTVEYYLDGECYKVSYRGKDGKTVTLWTDGVEHPLRRPGQGKAKRN